MIRAIFSASAGVAVVSDGDALFSIDIDRLEESTPCRPRDIAFLFGDAMDQQVAEFEDLKAVRQILETSWHCAEALQITLLLLDRQMDEETRTVAAGELNEALGREESLKYLESVFASAPLPASVNLETAMALANSVHAKQAMAMLDRIGRRQSLVHRVCRAFDAVPTRLFGEGNDRASVRAILVREGVFLAFIALSESGEFGTPVFAPLMSYGVYAEPNWHAILEAWAQALWSASSAVTQGSTVAASEDLFTAQRATRDLGGRLEGLLAVPSRHLPSTPSSWTSPSFLRWAMCGIALATTVLSGTVPSIGREIDIFGFKNFGHLFDKTPDSGQPHWRGWP